MPHRRAAHICPWACVSSKPCILCLSSFGLPDPIHLSKGVTSLWTTATEVPPDICGLSATPAPAQQQNPSVTHSLPQSHSSRSNRPPMWGQNGTMWNKPFWLLWLRFYYDNNLRLAARLKSVGDWEALQLPAGLWCCWIASSCRQGRTWPKWRGWTRARHHIEPTKHSVYNLAGAHVWLRWFER